MRIALVNGTRRRTGGVESYLEQLIPALGERGHEVAFVFENAATNDHESIQIPPEVPTWQADSTRVAAALQGLQDWRPNVVFLHSPVDAGLRAGLLRIARGVFFAHNYHGTCISGMKRHAFPRVRPCYKVFSAACLAHYLPRRCGGLSPLTMIQRYRAERAWLQGLQDFTAIVVASEHMANEYRRHGFGDRVHVVGLPVQTEGAALARSLPTGPDEAVRLLFVGRMETYKGGMLLLDCLPALQAQLRRKLHLTFAGDGRERGRWEAHAQRIVQAHPGIEMEFAGWLSGSALTDRFKHSHLLVLPSLWPEPFGLVGLEAGAYGLPTAAFDVGGISDWLKEGENGHLAPGDPPTAEGLNEAISKCLNNQERYLSLSTNASIAGSRFTTGGHLQKLESKLSACLATK